MASRMSLSGFGPRVRVLLVETVTGVLVVRKKRLRALRPHCPPNLVSLHAFDHGTNFLGGELTQNSPFAFDCDLHQRNVRFAYRGYGTGMPSEALDVAVRAFQRNPDIHGIEIGELELPAIAAG